MVKIEDIKKLDFGIYNFYYCGHEKPLPVLVGGSERGFWVNLIPTHFLPTYDLNYVIKGLERIEPKTQ